MKQILLATCVILMTFIQTNAQNSIMLNIHHKLGDAEFVMNEASKNNMSHDFKVTRLEYYISEISLIHDGGNETLIEDLWILADASTPTEVSLGEYDVNTVEKIVLHIGVDEAHNHLDPTRWDSAHPLAPKSPSMHWGWNAGYRFIAYEGHGGANYNQLFQLHGLGDSNYFTTEVELNVTAENNTVIINLDADYARGLEDIAVNTGVIVHGENLEARQCLENFRDFVFTESGSTSSTVDFSEVSDFGLFPNPVFEGISTIRLELKDSGNTYDVSISTVEGRQTKYHSKVANGQVVDFSDHAPGIYLVNLMKKGHVIQTQKLFVK